MASSKNHMGPVKQVQDPRDRKSDYDLGRIDFDWVEKTEDKKELSKALEALREDGGFPHLTEAVEKRLASLDPAFKRRMESQNVSQEVKSAVAEDIQSFLDDIQKMDQKLSRETYEREEKEKDIFGVGNNENKNRNNLNAQIEEIEKKKLAENERLKGNECMKAKEY